MADYDRLQKFYLAFYGRPADPGGLNYWATQMDSRFDNNDEGLASAFGSADQTEFRALYSSTPEVGTFIEAIYQNLFGRSVEDAGSIYWAGVYEDYLDSGYSEDDTRAIIIARIIDGANESDALGITNKTIVANAFTDEITASVASIGADDLVTARALVEGEGTDAWLAATLLTLAGTVDTIAANDTMAEYLTMLQYLSTLTSASSVVDATVKLSYSTTVLVESEENVGAIADTITITISGDTFAGAVGATNIGKVSNVPAGLTASLLKTSSTTLLLSLTGKATSHASANSSYGLKLTFSDTDFTDTPAKEVDGAYKDNLVVGFADAFLSEVDGVLTSGSGQITGAITINDDADTVMIGTKAVRLVEGAMSDVTSIDLSGAEATSTTGTATAGSVSYVGDENANTYEASYLGGSIQGGDGNDTLIGGAGIDKFVLSATADLNGVDLIQNFKIGTGGDVLNLSKFLTKTGTSKIAYRYASSEDSSTWASGDVLVVEGADLTTPASIAALFDTDGDGLDSVAPLATPTSIRKAVVITADLTGDALIWYLVKSANINTTITEENVVLEGEITKVGILEGLNTFSLLPFVIGNFA